MSTCSRCPGSRCSPPSRCDPAETTGHRRGRGPPAAAARPAAGAVPARVLRDGGHQRGASRRGRRQPVLLRPRAAPFRADDRLTPVPGPPGRQLRPVRADDRRGGPQPAHGEAVAAAQNARGPPRPRHRAGDAGLRRRPTGLPRGEQEREGDLPDPAPATARLARRAGAGHVAIQALPYLVPQRRHHDLPTGAGAPPGDPSNGATSR